MKSLPAKHKTPLALSAAAFIFISIIGLVLISTYAAAAIGKVEPENGTITPGAAKAQFSDASANYALEFGTTDTPGGGIDPNAVSITTYGAKCDGTSNDKAALEAGIADLQSKGGGTLSIPAGNCIIVQPGGGAGTALGNGVTIQGTAATSTLSLSLAAPGAYEKLFIVDGNNSALKNLILERSTPGEGMLLAMNGTVSNFTMDGVTLNGHYDTNRQSIHGIYIADTGSYKNIKILNSTITNTEFGLFQTNAATNTVDGITVDNSNFHHNYADDLEFNAPEAAMSNVDVTNSVFADNQYTDIAGAAGFGVGVANVQTGSIKNNTFNNYFMPPIHIEDRSANWLVDGNTFTNSSTGPLDYASHVFVINASHDITVTNNTMDTAGNTNTVYCVFSSPGGTGLPDPYNVSASGNTFKLRPNAQQSLGSVTLGQNTIENIP